MTFGRTGEGLFPSPAALSHDVAEPFNVVSVGNALGVQEHYYAISSERRIKYPALEAILSATRERVFVP